MVCLFASTLHDLLFQARSCKMNLQESCKILQDNPDFGGFPAKSFNLWIDLFPDKIKKNDFTSFIFGPEYFKRVLK